MAAFYFHELIREQRPGPYVIVGGGPSAAEHVDAWPAGATVISANEHGLRLAAERGTSVHFVVCLDDIAEKVRALNHAGVPVMNRRPWADIRLVEFWDCGFTGPVAAWLAYYMGACPVVVTGMDLYQGQTYWHGDAPDNGGHRIPREAQWQKWDSLRLRAPGIQVRALGGPLEELFGRFDPDEHVEPVPPRVHKLDPTGIQIRITREVCIAGVPFRVGDEPFVKARDAREVIRLGKAEAIDDGGRD